VADLQNRTCVIATTQLHTDSESASSRLNAAFTLGGQVGAPPWSFWIQKTPEQKWSISLWYVQNIPAADYSPPPPHNANFKANSNVIMQHSLHIFKGTVCIKKLQSPKLKFSVYNKLGSITLLLSRSQHGRLTILVQWDPSEYSPCFFIVYFVTNSHVTLSSLQIILGPFHLCAIRIILHVSFIRINS
jgi:hypothetical protein